MTNPTNTDLAAALREIADTLPLGYQLIVRLAADRLGEPVADKDGWIEWDHTAPNASDGPDLSDHVRIRAKFTDDTELSETVGYYRNGFGQNNWSDSLKYENRIVAYQILPD